MSHHTARHSLSLTFAALVAIALSSCQLPSTSGSGSSTVRRAESAGGGRLFAGAGSLNVPVHSSGINDVARMFAGLNGSSASPRHKQEMDALWRIHEYGRGRAVRRWASSEIGDLQRHRAMFYPFSGPTISLPMSCSPVRRHTSSAASSPLSRCLICQLCPRVKSPTVWTICARDCAASWMPVTS